jgi:hypothetical protein
VRELDDQVNAIFTAIAQNESLTAAKGMGMENLRREKALKHREAEEQEAAFRRQQEEKALLARRQHEQAAILAKALQKQNLLDAAALRIQAGTVSAMVRRNIKAWVWRAMQNAAASTIQGATLGHGVRIWTRIAFKMVAYEENSSACVLQGAFWGFKVRDIVWAVFEAKRRGIAKVQAVIRGYQMRREVGLRRRFKHRLSASVLSSSLRMFKQKLWMEKEYWPEECVRANDHAETIQTALRAMQLKLLFQRERSDLEDEAARKIQAIFPAKLSRDSARSRLELFATHNQVYETIADEIGTAASHAERVAWRARTLLNEVFGEKEMAMQMIKGQASEDAAIYVNTHTEKRRSVYRKRHNDAYLQGQDAISPSLAAYMACGPEGL